MSEAEGLRTRLASTSVVGAEAAEEVVAMIHAGFGSREMLDPPSKALDETIDTVRAALAEHGGLLARFAAGASHDTAVTAGALLFESHESALGLRRVSVHPDAQGHGVARGLVRAAEKVALERGHTAVSLAARAELPRTIHFWEHLGYTVVSRDGVFLTMARELPVSRTAPTADDTYDLGMRLASVLTYGDLVILNGELGAGKTTFTQGLGAGLGVRGDITSPTFVISRVHPATGDGPGLVHVDAYRLHDLPELDDLDLDASLEDSVTVVEWGSGIAEPLNDTRLEVRLARTAGGADGPPDSGDVATTGDDVRELTFVPHGGRWIGSGLRDALA